jgi:recombinational DNA repair protein (RecF pathway)
MSIDKKILENLSKILKENNQNEELFKLLQALLEKLDSGEDFDRNQIVEEILKKTNE